MPKEAVFSDRLDPAHVLCSGTRAPPRPRRRLLSNYRIYTEYRVLNY